MWAPCLTALQHVCSSQRSERTLGFISLKAQRSNVPPGFLRMTYQREAALALFRRGHTYTPSVLVVLKTQNYLTAVWRVYRRKTFSWQKPLPASLASLFPATVLHLKWRQSDSCVCYFSSNISSRLHSTSAAQGKAVDHLAAIVNKHKGRRLWSQKTSLSSLCLCGLQPRQRWQVCALKWEAITW